jgi:hypothetical protein
VPSTVHANHLAVNTFQSTLTSCYLYKEQPVSIVHSESIPLYDLFFSSRQSQQQGHRRAQHLAYPAIQYRTHRRKNLGSRPLFVMAAPAESPTSSSSASPDGKAQGAVAAQSLGLIDCSSEGLSSWLLANRFGGDEMAATAFLLNAAAALPSAKSVSDRLRDGGGTSASADATAPTIAAAASMTTNDDEDDLDLGPRAAAPAALRPGGSGAASAAGASPPPSEGSVATAAVSLTNPRGKFALEWHEAGLKLVDGKGNPIAIRRGSVQHVVVFPKPEDMLRAKRNSHPSRSSGNGIGDDEDEGCTKKKEPSMAMHALIVFRRGAGCLYKNKALAQI